MLNNWGVRRSPTVIWLLVLVYAWTFPFLRLVHWDADDHASVLACNGFAAENAPSNAAGGPLVESLHILPHHPPCSVCALARSATLAPVTVFAPLPILVPLTDFAPEIALSRTERSPARTPGARAPPLA